jgi:hypothetical protein
MSKGYGLSVTQKIPFNTNCNSFATLRPFWKGRKVFGASKMDRKVFKSSFLFRFRSLLLNFHCVFVRKEVLGCAKKPFSSFRMDGLFPFVANELQFVVLAVDRCAMLRFVPCWQMIFFIFQFPELPKFSTLSGHNFFPQRSLYPTCIQAQRTVKASNHMKISNHIARHNTINTGRICVQGVMAVQVVGVK